MGDNHKYPKLEIHSPIGVEPFSYSWPLITGNGPDKHDAGQDIIDTIRWVCEELPQIKSALEEIKFHEINTSNYDAMRDLCDRYNKAISSVVALVSLEIFCKNMFDLIFLR